MPKNKIEDLRNMLFETIEKLMDDEDPMDLERAETVAKVAQVVINTAKVEVDFMKHTGYGGTSFIQENRANLTKLTPARPAGQLKALTISSEGYEELCTKCPLPDCDETSAQCLIQIERRAAA